MLEKLPGIGVVTRNRYGAQVLNADAVMFLDWDVKPEDIHGALSAPTGFLKRLARIFGGVNDSDRQAAVQVAKQTLEARVRARVAEIGVSLRLYETRNGLRGIVTSSLFDPTDDLAQDLMRFLGADPLYTRLCRIQATFRARLTPKFWRIGINTRPATKPPATPEEHAALRAWLEVYAARSANFATARFIAQLGSRATDAVLLETLRLHDARCNVDSRLELA